MRQCPADHERSEYPLEFVPATALRECIAAAEDLADLEAARLARAEIADEGTIPWEQVKVDLGLA